MNLHKSNKQEVTYHLKESKISVSHMVKVYLTVDPRVVLRKAVSFIFNNLEISNISVLIPHTYTDDKIKYFIC